MPTKREVDEYIDQMIGELETTHEIQALDVVTYGCIPYTLFQSFP